MPMPYMELWNNDTLGYKRNLHNEASRLQINVAQQNLSNNFSFATYLFGAREGNFMVQD